MNWNELPTETRLILVWLGLVRTNTHTGQCTVHPSAPARLRKMAREIESTYPEIEAETDDAPGPFETSAKKVSLNVFRKLRSVR
jgi:hypothetical protein